jgi:hypothetical protein
MKSNARPYVVALINLQMWLRWSRPELSAGGCRPL